jgi:hypothetical protein
MDEARIVARLSEVDWNFPGATTMDNSVHSLHWFPGNFIPEIPSFLVQCLSEPGQLIVDPFCGSGTTPAEAIALKRRAWAMDANRVATLISRGKCALLSDNGCQVSFQSVAEAVSWGLDATADLPLESTAGTACELEKWYHPETLSELRAIWRILEQAKYAPVQPVLEMLFSDTLFSCVSSCAHPGVRPGRKRRRHHWGWIADNVQPAGLVWHDARGAFLARVSRALDVLSAGRLPVPIEEMPVVCRGDARHMPFRSEVVDLVVTSPPYVGMIDYATANRLTYLWFNWHLPSDKAREIGARYRRNKKSELADYLTSMRAAGREVARVLRPGGFCAIVIGASRKYPDASASVIEVFRTQMRLLWGPIARTPSRRRVSNRDGSEFEEFLCLFRKD